MRIVRLLPLIALAWVVAGSTAYAQTSIAGVVKDRPAPYCRGDC